VLFESWTKAPDPVFLTVTVPAMRPVKSRVPAIVSMVGSTPANVRVLAVVAPATVTVAPPELLMVSRFRVNVAAPMLFVVV
jgi:hypothetical protein